MDSRRLGRKRHIIPAFSRPERKCGHFPCTRLLQIDGGPGARPRAHPRSPALAQKRIKRREILCTVPFSGQRRGCIFARNMRKCLRIRLRRHFCTFSSLPLEGKASRTPAAPARRRRGVRALHAPQYRTVPPPFYHQTGDVTHGPTHSRPQFAGQKSSDYPRARAHHRGPCHLVRLRPRPCRRRPQRHGRARRHRDGYARRRADRDVSRRRPRRLYAAAVRRAGHAHRRGRGHTGQQDHGLPQTARRDGHRLPRLHARARRPLRRHAGRHRGLPGAHALQLRHLEQQRRVSARHARGRNGEPRHHRTGRGRHVRPRQRDRDRPRPAAALQRRQQPEPHPARGLRQQRLPLHRRRRVRERDGRARRGRGRPLRRHQGRPPRQPHLHGLPPAVRGAAEVRRHQLRRGQRVRPPARRHAQPPARRGRDRLPHGPQRHDRLPLRRCELTFTTEKEG